MVNFLLGIIIGILIRDIKVKTLHQIEKLKEKHEAKGDAQFLEPTTFSQKFQEADDIGDLLE